MSERVTRKWGYACFSELCSPLAQHPWPSHIVSPRSSFPFPDVTPRSFPFVLLVSLLLFVPRWRCWLLTGRPLLPRHVVAPHPHVLMSPAVSSTPASRSIAPFEPQASFFSVRSPLLFSTSSVASMMERYLIDLFQALIHVRPQPSVIKQHDLSLLLLLNFLSLC